MVYAIAERRQYGRGQCQEERDRSSQEIHPAGEPLLQGYCQGTSSRLGGALDRCPLLCLKLPGLQIFSKFGHIATCQPFPTMQDNGSGMPHKDIPNMLGRVLSGTKYGVKQVIKPHKYTALPHKYTRKDTIPQPTGFIPASYQGGTYYPVCLAY